MDTATASSTRSQLGFNAEAQKINQTLAQTQSTLTQTSSKMGILNNNFSTLNTNFNPTVGGLTRSNTVMGNLGKTADSTGQRFSKLGGFMKNNLTNVSLLAGGLAGLDDQFLSLHKAQVASERASLIVDKAHNRLADTDRKLAQMVKDGKEGTVEYNALMADRALVAEQVRISEEKLSVASEQLGERTEDFAVSILPNLIFVGGSAISMIKDMGINMTKMKGVFGIASAAMTGFASTTLGATGAVTGLKTALLLIGGPLAAIIAGFAIGETVTRAQTQVWDSYAEALDVVPVKLNAIELAWLGLNRALGTINEADRKRLEQWEKQNELLTNLHDRLAKAGKDVPPLANLIGMSPEQKQKLINDVKTLGGDVSKELKAVGMAASEAAQNFSPLVNIIQETNTALRSTTGDQIFNNSISKAEQYSNSIIDINKRLVEHAMQLNVDQKLINSYSYIEGQSTDQIIENNLQLKKQIASRKAHAVILGEESDAFGENVASLEAQQRREREGIGLVEQEISQAQRRLKIQQDLKQAQDNLTAAWDRSTQFINNNLDGFFEKFATPAEKLKKLIEKDMNQIFKINPKIEADWKLTGKEDQLRQRIEAQLKAVFEKVTDNAGNITISPRISMPDKDWDKFGKDLIKDIDNSVKGKSPEWTHIKEELQKAIESTDTGAALSKLMNSPEFIRFFNPTMEIEIAQKSIIDLTKKLAAAIAAAMNNNGHGWAVEMRSGVPGGTQYTESEKDRIWAGEEAKGGWTTHGSFSEQLSKLSSAQIQELRRKGIINRQTRPDSIDDQAVLSGYGGKWASPRDAWNYDQGPHFRTKNGSLWQEDVTGQLYRRPREQETLNRYGQGWTGNLGPSDITRIAYGTGSQGKGAYRDPLGFMTSGGGGTGSTNKMFGTSPISKMKEDLSKANPLDILARQVDQITKNLNMLARAVSQNTVNMNTYARTVVQVTTDNNVYAQTIVQVTADHNILARTVNQLTKDNNIYAKTTAQITKNNNTYARTVAEIIKDHNTYARTITEIIKDHNTLAKTTVQITKNNNTLARTVNQLTSNFKALANAIDSVPRNVNIHVGASGPGLQFAQHGMHTTLAHDQLIYAHKGERVDIGHGGGGGNSSNTSGGSTGSQPIMNIVEIHDHHDDRNTVRSLKMKMGQGRSKFGL